MYPTIFFKTKFSKLILTAFASCLFVVGSFPLTAADSAEYKRIVSIGGSVTEIIYAMGEEERLVARDTTSTYPQLANELPDIGYIRRLSPEGVLSVNPDLIIALEGSGPPETMATLREASIPVVEIPEGYTKGNIIEKIRAVGDALGVAKKAEVLSAEVSEKFDETIGQNNEQSSPQKVLFVLAMREGKILASGKSTGADSIISLAGSENIISQFDGYKPVNDESIIQGQPDVILMMQRGRRHSQSDEEVLSHPAIAATPAGKNKKIVRMDGLYLLGFGPRTAMAVRDLQQALQ